MDIKKILECPRCPWSPEIPKDSWGFLGSPGARGVFPDAKYRKRRKQENYKIG
jgi:hypothetical protein